MNVTSQNPGFLQSEMLSFETRHLVAGERSWTELDTLFVRVLETVGDPPDCREDHHLDMATESEWCPHPLLITLKVPSTNDNVMSCLVPGPLISGVRWVECLMCHLKG